MSLDLGCTLPRLFNTMDKRKIKEEKPDFNFNKVMNKNKTNYNLVKYHTHKKNTTTEDTKKKKKK